LFQIALAWITECSSSQITITKTKKVLPKEKKTRNSLVTHTSWGKKYKKKRWKLEAGSPMINVHGMEERSTKLKCVHESISF
jgi:hypothetical protein